MHIASGVNIQVWLKMTNANNKKISYLMASSRSTGTTFGVTGKKTGQLKPGKSSSETLLATKPQKLSRPSDKLNPKTVDPVSIVTMVIIASQTDQIRFRMCLFI